MLRIYTRFDKNRPQWSYIISKNDVQYVPLFAPDTGLTLNKVFDNVEIIREIFQSGVTVLTHNFKDQIASFELQLSKNRYNVYDCADFSLDTLNQDLVAEKISSKDKMEWQKVFANASVVYQSLQNRGLRRGCHSVKPTWDLKTYTGRSRTSGFNLQGATSEDDLSPVTNMVDPYFLNFDWVAADMRAASIISDDFELSRAFLNSDPYVAVAEIFNCGVEYDPLTRDEAKLALLQSINSMDFDSHVLKPFNGLSAWIRRCKKQLDRDGFLESLLGRRFYVDREHARSYRSSFNATMQGTVAHAMHSTIRSVWEIFDIYVFADSHDSLSMVVPKSCVDQAVEMVTSIMSAPFKDIIDSNPHFPVVAYLGKKWKRWRRIDRTF